MHFFRDQVSSDSYLIDIFFLLATVCLVLVVAGIGLIDSGLSRRRNILDTWVQKIGAALIAGGAFLIVGYGIWNWQFFQALGIKNPLGEAIKGWWIGGANMNHFSQNLDPAVTPQADTYQVFAGFFVAYAAVIAALIHSAGLERVKALPMYIIALIVGGLVMPIEAYLTWGSASFLTNHGTHDYLGIFSGYILAGVWGLILAWRLRPRLGAFDPHNDTSGPFPGNLGTAASGVGLLLFAVPFLAVGCGYLVPGSGYFGIAGSTSGFGIVILNVFASFAGGFLGGAFIAYRTRNSLFALIGPIAGYVGMGTAMDIVHPWVAFIVSFFSPFAFWGVYNLMIRLRLDEKKVVPLGLGCGIYGAVAGGIVGWHTKTGGYFGLRGAYALQHAQVTPWMQLAGVAVTIVTAGAIGLVVIIGLEKTIGLRVREQDELLGLDAAHWGAPPEPVADYAPVLGNGSSVPAATPAGIGAGLQE